MLHYIHNSNTKYHLYEGRPVEQHPLIGLVMVLLGHLPPSVTVSLPQTGYSGYLMVLCISSSTAPHSGSSLLMSTNTVPLRAITKT